MATAFKRQIKKVAVTGSRTTERLKEWRVAVENGVEDRPDGFVLTQKKNIKNKPRRTQRAGPTTANTVRRFPLAAGGPGFAVASVVVSVAPSVRVTTRTWRT